MATTELVKGGGGGSRLVGELKRLRAMGARDSRACERGGGEGKGGGHCSASLTSAHAPQVLGNEAARVFAIGNEIAWVCPREWSPAVPVLLCEGWTSTTVMSMDVSIRQR